jgi:hypothetical protein
MFWRRMSSSFIYAVGQLGLGLFFHPYLTMQSIVQEKVFLWMTLFPSVVLAVVTILWRGGIVPVIRLFFSCHTTPILACDFLPLLSNWLTFFCLYWQILVLYLFFRFSHVFRE